MIKWFKQKYKKSKMLKRLQKLKNKLFNLVEEKEDKLKSKQKRFSNQKQKIKNRRLIMLVPKNRKK